MYTRIEMLAIFIVALLLTTSNSISQQPEPNALVSLYQSARASYSDQQFQKSAKQFQSVAEKCPGSELAIQCEYFSVMSEWATEPCDGCANKLSAWLVKAKRFQVDAIATGRSVDSKQLLKWFENAELLQAKWDRQQQRFELAEQRLRALLVSAATDSTVTRTIPKTWLELGSLLLENRQDYAAARTCFDNVLQNAKDPEPACFQAILGCALACWYSQQYTEARVFLNQLSLKPIDVELKIQSQLLNIKIAKALGESIDVAQALNPVIQIALESTPPAAALYELAMELIDSGEKSSSNEILLQLVHRYPQSPFSIEARVRLARNASEKGQWKEAADWSEQAIALGCSIELRPYAHLLRGQAQLELGIYDKAKSELEAALAIPSRDRQLEISIRFQLAESLYHLQQWEEADSLWKWLVHAAESTDDIAHVPDWYPVVLLRSAELLALRKEWGQAESLVLRIRNDFPKCNRACEVDYLLARCLVSKADFDAARQVLNSLMQRANATPDELLARGSWMLGETYLMQRNYSDALIAYRNVLKIPNQEYWSSAAHLQIAKCCEAAEDLHGAKEAYETIISQFSHSPFVLTAKERLSIIPSISIANQPAKELSGSKR